MRGRVEEEEMPPTGPALPAGAAWPELPQPGRLVRLPLPLPPMFLEALGCATARRYVIMWWGGGTAGEVFWSDGVQVLTSPPPAWLALTRHNVLCRVVFDAYDLEDDPASPTWDPAHRLVVDRRDATLDVAVADDAAMLLATEPDADPAAAPPSAAPLRHPAAEAARRAGLVETMCAWLDATLDWVDTGAGTLPAPQQAGAGAATPGA